MSANTLINLRSKAEVLQVPLAFAVCDDGSQAAMRTLFAEACVEGKCVHHVIHVNSPDHELVLQTFSARDIPRIHILPPSVLGIPPRALAQPPFYLTGPLLTREALYHAVLSYALWPPHLLEPQMTQIAAAATAAEDAWQTPRPTAAVGPPRSPAPPPRPTAAPPAAHAAHAHPQRPAPTAAPAAAPTAATEATAAPTAAGVGSGAAALVCVRLRFPDGEELTLRERWDATLEEVREKVKEYTSTERFYLSQAFPPHRFTAEEMTRTFEQLRFPPNNTVRVTFEDDPAPSEPAQGASAQEEKANRLSQFLSYLMSSKGGKAPPNPPPANANPQPARPAPKKSFGSMAALRREEEDKPPQRYFGGDSTEYQARKDE